MTSTLPPKSQLAELGFCPGPPRSEVSARLLLRLGRLRHFLGGRLEWGRGELRGSHQLPSDGRFGGGI